MILSINPCYVEKIISGEKIYEFRKFKPSKSIDRIYIYETSPIKKIIGFFKYTDVIIGEKKSIWNKYYDVSGISQNNYFEYYSNSVNAYVYKISELKVLADAIDPYKTIDGFRAPQSYRYMERGKINELICNLV